MRRIVFVEPKPPDLHIFTRMPMPRLGTVLLGTILRQKGYEVKSYVEVVRDLDIEDILKADAVGISTITSTAPRAYELARQIKRAGIPVFMGGPHTTCLPDEALEHCDYVLRGEADEVIADFVAALEKGSGFEAIPGLSFRENGRVIHNESVAVCRQMDNIPCPDFTIVSGLEDGLHGLSITPIMTSRGCPYDCSFCSVTGMFGRQYRFRSQERVLEELARHREMGGKFVFFYDDNFAANRQRTKELLRSMIEQNLTPPWTAQVRVEVARDPELMELMQRSNCHTLYLGFESVNPETLKAYNKRQTVEDIEKCIERLHAHNIRIHGMFVFGADDDTVDTIHETVKFAKENDLESLQFLILTPLPGTRMFHELESQDRLISRDWSLYDTHHVVFEPKGMTPYELQLETIKATARFYSMGQIAKRFVRLDMFNVSIKAYGRRLAKKWARKNESFLEYTKNITEAGRQIELAARNTAEDIRERFSQLEASGGFPGIHADKPR
ncbi:MAG: B12-binding domain-containing radical SAM protein [Nitrospirota bacterium]|nr:B12-binding domain-containing radical SAM protein [Nitrospirota bacterium]